MDKEERLRHLFNLVHGERTTNCYTEIVFNTEGAPTGINLMKDGNICWTVSVLDLLFAYVMKKEFGDD